jgi:osmotically-inducible protein OsmY
MGFWLPYAASRAVGKLVKGALGDGPAPTGDYLHPDEKARQQLCAQLAAEGASTLHGSVQVSVLSGEVLLTGSVSSAAEQKRVDALARALPGVRSVRSELTVR